MTRTKPIAQLIGAAIWGLFAILCLVGSFTNPFHAGTASMSAFLSYIIYKHW